MRSMEDRAADSVAWGLSVTYSIIACFTGGNLHSTIFSVIPPVRSSVNEIYVPEDSSNTGYVLMRTTLLLLAPIIMFGK